jgi:Mn2+/Fe2+ NRAMP family transporter
MLQAARRSPKPTGKPEKPAVARCASGALAWFSGAGTCHGAADDDPSGIATYSQIGAQFGCAMLWTLLAVAGCMLAGFAFP